MVYCQISNPPGFLYASFYLEGINIYKYSKGQVTLSESFVWENFTEATVDFFAMSTTLVLIGESHSTTLIMMDSGKKLIPKLQSYTNIKVNIVDRPWWRKILGFRSNTKWKMAVATVIYLVLASKIVGAYSGNNVKTISSTNASSSSSRDVSVDPLPAQAPTKPAVADAETQSIIIPGLDAATVKINLQNKYGLKFNGFTSAYDNAGNIDRTKVIDAGSYTYTNGSAVSTLDCNIDAESTLRLTYLTFIVSGDLAITKNYLGYCASIPYENSKPAEAKQWVEDNCMKLANGKNVTKQIGNVKLILTRGEHFIELDTCNINYKDQ